MAPPQALWNHRQTASTANETEGWALDGRTDGVLARTRWPGCESTNLRIFLKRFRDRSSYPGYISRVLEFRSQGRIREIRWESSEIGQGWPPLRFGPVWFLGSVPSGFPEPRPSLASPLNGSTLARWAHSCTSKTRTPCRLQLPRTSARIL